MSKKIYIGSDHAGYKLKEEIKKYLTKINISYKDLGNVEFDPKDDYPDYAQAVAKKVAKTKSKGILICNSGVGMCIAANKIKGIRAVNAYNEKITEKSREHNDTNILCLGQDYINAKLAKKIIKAWLKTKTSTVARHKRRVKKMDKM